MSDSDPVILELELLKFDSTMKQLKEVTTALQDVNKAMGIGGSGGGALTRIPKPAKPPKAELTVQEKVMKALMSSRFGASGGIMPLVSKTADIFGKFGPAVLAATVAVKALADMTTDAAELMKKAADNFYDTGGSPGELGRADNISRMSGDDINRLALEHQAAINGGGLPTAFANQHGISDNPGMPKLDALTDYLQHLRDLSDPAKTSQEQAQREIKANPSLRPAMRLRDLSDNSRDEILNHAREEMFSPENRRSAAEYQATIADIGREWDKFKEDIASPVIEIIGWIGRMTGHFKGLADTLEMLASPLTAAMSLFRHIHDLVSGIGALAGGASMEDANKIAAGASEKAIEATKENTAAVREQTQIMREGTYGGGSRARGAIPAAYRGANGGNTEKFLQNQANALGAFGLGT